MPANVKPTYLFKVLDLLGPSKDELDEHHEEELIRTVVRGDVNLPLYLFQHAQSANCWAKC